MRNMSVYHHKYISCQFDGVPFPAESASGPGRWHIKMLYLLFNSPSFWWHVIIPSGSGHLTEKSVLHSLPLKCLHLQPSWENRSNVQASSSLTLFTTSLSSNERSPSASYRISSWDWKKEKSRSSKVSSGSEYENKSTMCCTLSRLYDVKLLYILTIWIKVIQ